METIKISELPTGTPTIDDIVMFVDRNDGLTKQADQDEFPSGTSTLSSLTDVNVTTPTNGQSLIYETTSSKWKNQALVADAINDGTTTVAPSQNAVFDALALKLDATSYDDATSAEVNTGTSTAKYVSPDSLAGSNLGIRYIACSLNGTTALTTSEKVYFRIPSGYTGMNLISVTGTVGTGASGASSSGNPTFTVKNVTDGNQMLTTSLTIDSTEYTSATAATAVVINTSYDDVVTDDLIEVAVTTSGTGVTYAQVILGFQLP